MTQPEALRLADALDDEFTQGRISNHNGRKAAAELRRLYEFAMEQQGKIYALEMARSMQQRTAKLKHDVLLEANTMQAYEIVRLAKEASFDWDGFSLPDRMAIYHFADLVAAAEREACAAICDTTPPYPFRPSIEAAHAIRARSNT